MRIRGFASCGFALFIAAAGCNTLNQQDQIRLTTFKQNSKRFYEAGQYRRAEDACRKGLILDPKDMSLNQALGYSLLCQGGPPQVQEAVLVFQECVNMEREYDFRNHLGLGEARLQLGLLWERQQGAIEADERLTIEEREQKLANAQERMEESFMRAEDELLGVLESPRGRDHFHAQSTLVRLYSILHRYEEAAEVLRTMIANLSNSIHVRSENMSMESLPVDRRDHYEKMLASLEERRVEGLRLLATIAAKMYRWEEVSSAYAQLDALQAMQPADYFNRARAYEALRSREAAIQNYDTFVHQAASRGASFIEMVSEAMRRADSLRAGGEFLTQS